MKKIALFGSGGFGHELAAFINIINEANPQWQLIGFFDDNLAKGVQVSKYGVTLGTREDLKNWPEPLAVAIAIGNPKTVNTLVDYLSANPNVTFPNLISPDFTVDDPETFSIGRGNIIKRHCAATTNVSIGNFNILNGSVVLGHDVVVKDYNCFMPGVRISGQCEIGSRNLFGAMSFVKQCLKVGNDITLSPLSALLTKPKEGNTYIGNPAKLFKI